MRVSALVQMLLTGRSAELALRQHSRNRTTRYDVSKITHLCGSCCIVDFVAPSVDDWLTIDVADEGDQAFLEFVFGADADMAQHRTRQLGEEALDEIEP
jgi:hypothetical protein